MRARIANDGDGPLLVVDTLREFIGAIPALRGDPMRAGEPAWDDALTIAQETRYACLAQGVRRAASRPDRPRKDEQTRRSQSGRASRENGMSGPSTKPGCRLPALERSRT
jgi:hypothetical protein